MEGGDLYNGLRRVLGPSPGEPLVGRRGGMIIAGAGPGGRPAARWGRGAKGGGRKARSLSYHRNVDTHGKAAMK